MLDLNFRENCFNNMTDEELILTDDSRAVSVLVVRYIGIILHKARMMSNDFVDTDDLVQEGLLGFLNAVSKFNTEYNTKFSTFAEVCVTNKMKTVLARNKNKSFLNDKIEDNEFSPDTPESIFLQKENLSEMYGEMIAVLSERELEIFRMFLKGMSYKGIALKKNTSVKSVDNAMQRIRRKLKIVWSQKIV